MVVLVVPIVVVTVLLFLRSGKPKPRIKFYYSTIARILAVSFSEFRLINIGTTHELSYWYGLCKLTEKAEYKNWVIKETSNCAKLSSNDEVWAQIDENQLRQRPPKTCPEVASYLANQGSGIVMVRENIPESLIFLKKR